MLYCYNEQGTIGFALILFLIIWRISVNVKLSKNYNDRFLEASSCALFGLYLATLRESYSIFSFWTIIAFSYVFFDIYKKNNLEEKNN